MKRNLLIFVIFGLAYGLIEILWRGYTHPSMVILGGICGLIIGLLNEITKHKSINTNDTGNDYYY